MTTETNARGLVEYEYEVWQGDALQAGGSTTDYASAQSEAGHYAMMYASGGPVEVRIYEKRLLSAAPPPADAEPKTLPVPTRVYLTDKAAVIVGYPQRGWDEEGPDAHNCDDMGCPTFGRHVLARVPFTDERAEQPAAPSGERGDEMNIAALPSAVAHEIWAAAQLAPGEGIVDGAARVEALLSRYPLYSQQSIEALRAEAEKLRALAACAYQMAGMHDAPLVWLDRLSEAANDGALPDVDTLMDELLPYQPDAVCEAEAENKRLRAEVEDYRTNGAAAVRFAPSSAYWTNELRRLFGDEARNGRDILESRYRQELTRAERLAEALRDAEKSLRTIADRAGGTEYLMTIGDVRGYANSRANAASAVLRDQREG